MPTGQTDTLITWLMEGDPAIRWMALPRLRLAASIRQGTVTASLMLRYDDGERIYHMPGDEFYEETEIDPDYAEHYFCTPNEAEAAGFRRAYR